MSWLDRYFTKAYTTVQVAGSALPTENALNFASGFTAVDNPASGRTDISFSGASSTGSISTSAAGTSTATLATLALGEVYTFDVIVTVNRGSPGAGTVAAWKLQGLFVGTSGPAATLSGSITTTAFGGGTGLFTAPTLTVSGASVLLQVTSPDTTARVWTWEAHIVKAASLGGGGAPGPTVLSVYPPVSFALTSVAITVTGTDFVNGVGLGVKINNIDCSSVTWVNSTTITCVTPTLTESNHTVQVTNPDAQTGSLATSFLALDSRIWLRADLFVLDGGGVKCGTWTDKSGHSNSFISSGSGNGPTPNPTGIGGKPSMTFTSTGVQILTKSTFSPPSECEIFVIKKNIGTGFMGLWEIGSSGVSDLVPFNGDTHVYQGAGSTTRRDLGIPVVTMTNGHLTDIQSAAGNWSEAFNLSAPWFTSGTNTPGFAANLKLGANFGGNGYAGEIGELIMMPRVLNTTERGIVRTFLTSYYSIP